MGVGMERQVKETLRAAQEVVKRGEETSEQRSEEKIKKACEKRTVT